jgi:hypothetical protein
MKRQLPILILLACAALFAAGVVQLFELRFAAGDVYPAYSSLRADPLGTMALYESLQKIPGITVGRDFGAANRLPDEPGTVYLHLAAEAHDWDSVPDDLYHEVRDFLARGGRLVIMYFPETRPSRNVPDEADQTNSAAGAKFKGTNHPSMKSARPRQAPSAAENSWVDLEDKWGFHEGFEKLPRDGETYEPVTVTNPSRPSLPASLNWHSGMIFTHCDAAWQAIYLRGEDPVVLERKFGRGSVVLASDSYCLSNEALARDRHAELLAWLIGPNSRVVFDEAHLGILESPGVASLMRRYHLHGLAAGLLLLAGLFIWRNSTSLAPPPAEAQTEDFVPGRDAASGFVNLLRRNIPAREVFDVCFAEWKKSAASSGNYSRARLLEAEAIFKEDNARPAGQRNPLATYQRISETLGNRREKL